MLISARSRFAAQVVTGTDGALRGGYDFTQNFGVEADILFGVVDETVNAFGTDVDVSADIGFGGFGVARLPLGENNSNLFIRAGYGTLNIEGEALGVTVAEDVDGFAYGLGGEFYFDGVNGVRVDYTIYDGDDGDLDTYGIHYIRRFSDRTPISCGTRQSPRISWCGGFLMPRRQGSRLVA